MNVSWLSHPLLRIACLLASCLAAAALLSHCMQRNRAAVVTAGPAQQAVPEAPPAPTVVSVHENSLAVLARCEPQLGLTPSFVPKFEVGDNYNKAAVQMKVHFWVEFDGFVKNAYLERSGAVTGQDQEAALDYVQHLSFSVPNNPECRGKKLQMTGLFRMSKNSRDEWDTLFEVHPVYSLNGSQVVVNP